jgi:type IV pilus assembly protein PilC
MVLPPFQECCKGADMPKFNYRAINESGKTLSGVIEADCQETVKGILAERGFIPSRIREEGERLLGFTLTDIYKRLTSIKPQDLIIFTKQFRTMVRAGVPILSLLQVLENQTENLRLVRIINSMTQDIKNGSTLYEAFNKHPKAFSPLYCSMVKAGEFSGALAEVLDRLIYIIEHEHKVKLDIKSALQYPILVVVFLGVAFFVLLTFIIPKFVKIFINAGITLPMPTRICLGLYHFLSEYWVLILGVGIVAIGVLLHYLRTEQGRYVRDTIFLNLPIFGPLFRKAVMSRFASIFAILHASGIHVLDSIEILSGTIGNTAVSKEFNRISDQVKEGKGISSPLRSARYFTPMVINMVSIGEESGNLNDMLHEISVHYDDEVDYAIKRLSDAIGPILIICLAAIVGFFALAVFLPWWDLTRMVRPG